MTSPKRRPKAAGRAHPGRYERIYAVVSRIPRGRVATYGQIAELAGLPGCARQVGYALHALPGHRSVPWQRVINARGEVSSRSEPGMEQVQRHLLESEGVVFAESGRVVLSRYQWRPRARKGRLSIGSRAQSAGTVAPRSDPTARRSL